MFVAVGSLSRVKFNATLAAVRRLGMKHRVKAVKVSSGVGDQPVGMQSLMGARNRARRAMEIANADLGVGMEGGLLNLLGSYYIGAVCCATNQEGIEGLATTCLFLAPKGLERRMRSGRELGDIMDEVTQTRGVKHSIGAIGILTGGVVTRTRAYQDAAVLALSRFAKPRFYEKLGSL